MGVSPKQLLGLLTVEHAKALLRDAESVLGAALEVGLSGPSRLHDLFVKIEAITPGEYRAEGRGLTMRWGIHPTPFGEALFVVARTAQMTDGRIAFGETHLFVGRGYVVSVRHGASSSHAPVRERCEASPEAWTDDVLALSGLVRGSGAR